MIGARRRERTLTWLLAEKRHQLADANRRNMTLTQGLVATDLSLRDAKSKIAVLETAVHRWQHLAQAGVDHVGRRRNPASRTTSAADEAESFDDRIYRFGEDAATGFFRLGELTVNSFFRLLNSSADTGSHAETEADQ